MNEWKSNMMAGIRSSKQEINQDHCDSNFWDNQGPLIDSHIKVNHGYSEFINEFESFRPPENKNTDAG